MVIQEIKCPKCGAEETFINKAGKELLLIRGYKVHDNGRWWSQCLVCSGYYPDPNNLEISNENYNTDNAYWF